MTTDKSWVRILIYNDCGTEKFLNVFFPVLLNHIVDPLVIDYRTPPPPIINWSAYVPRFQLEGNTFLLAVLQSNSGLWIDDVRLSVRQHFLHFG